MPLIIVVIAIIIAAAALVYALSFARNSGKSAGTSVVESFDAWRSDELDMDTYDIVHHDTAVDDMFEAFAHESEAYITSETLDEHFDRARETEREISETVRRNSEKLRARIPAPPLRRRAVTADEENRAEAEGAGVAEVVDGADPADGSVEAPEEDHGADITVELEETLIVDMGSDVASGGMSEQSRGVDDAESFVPEDTDERERRSA
ncbi:hypothetical protein [Actinotignum schaalii]|uniref:hypothetical protein n=1 Tax=Actinotignum schaalii TaxID=59505 RepID=UPI00041E89D2|nr:hypothetical protein [Actinotignum schaalii]AIE82006.1 hypothetical protein FB03_00515 [Actinotignum schaalii]WQN45680.1 hypothetical protein U4A90_03035 [Actinotignum schaalii]